MDLRWLLVWMGRCWMLAEASINCWRCWSCPGAALAGVVVLGGQRPVKGFSLFTSFARAIVFFLIFLTFIFLISFLFVGPSFFLVHLVCAFHYFVYIGCVA